MSAQATDASGRTVSMNITTEEGGEFGRGDYTGLGVILLYSVSGLVDI